MRKLQRMNGYHDKPTNPLVLIIGAMSKQLDECKELIKQHRLLSFEAISLINIDQIVMDVFIPLTIIFDPEAKVPIFSEIEEFRRKHPETKILFFGEAIEKGLEARIRELGVIFIGSHHSCKRTTLEILQKAIQLGET